MPLGLQDRVAHLVALESQARVALYQIGTLLVEPFYLISSHLDLRTS
jgi:hypothetical protein